MKGRFRRRAWLGCAAAAFLALAAVPVMLAALDAGYFRPLVVRYLEAHFHRPIRIEGPLRLQLWSRHPRVVAQQLFIGNPPWIPGTAQGGMARIGRLTLIYSAPGFGRRPSLESVIMEQASLDLKRDAQGRANWHRTDSTAVRGKGLPLIKELSAEGVHVLLDDQRRHLNFDGIVSAHGPRQAPPQRLHIEGKGQLNGRPVSFELNGDPLESVRADGPYVWEFTEDSGGSHLNVRGSLPEPFDFDRVDAKFDASGEDLRDLYHLTGVTLLNTGEYRLSGSVQRRGAQTRFDQLQLHTGHSDLGGTLIFTSAGRPHLDAVLTAGLLRTADFGARAAGRAPPAGAIRHVFSDAMFNPAALRRTVTLLRFDAQRIEVGKILLQSAVARMTIDHGVLTAAPLTAGLLQGRVESRLRIDANQATPAVTVGMHFNNLQLAALDRKQSRAPVEGLLQVQIELTGTGRSLHQVAETATGTVSAASPGGTIRASLAEIAGIDLRGLGLTLTHSKRETALRCAVADFQARSGTLTARSIVIDTTPVLITGEGEISLGSEALHLTLRGQPKTLRLLRLDAPLVVEGTLARPQVVVQTHDAGVELVDRGSGKDVDCAQLLASSGMQAASASGAP